MTSGPHPSLADGSPAAERRYRLSDLPVPMVAAAYRIIVDCNESFAGQFGYERRELINGSFRRLYANTGEFVLVGRLWGAHLASGLVYFDERVMRRKDGSRFWCRVHGRSMTPADPFAEAVYCFEPMQRGVAPTEHTLTGRQRQVLAAGRAGPQQPGDRNGDRRSRRTVEAHRARLMKAIGVRNGAEELIAWIPATNANSDRIARSIEKSAVLRASASASAGMCRLAGDFSPAGPSAVSPRRRNEPRAYRRRGRSRNAACRT